MGHVQYYLLYKDQPSVYRRGANPGNKLVYYNCETIIKHFLRFPWGCWWHFGFVGTDTETFKTNTFTQWQDTHWWLRNDY